jgi:hypothetical protein
MLKYDGETAGDYLILPLNKGLNNQAKTIILNNDYNYNCDNIKRETQKTK